MKFKADALTEADIINIFHMVRCLSKFIVWYRTGSMSCIAEQIAPFNLHLH